MAAKIYGVFILIFIMLLTVMGFSFSYITVADQDNETSVENAVRNAMTQSVNLGRVRVAEEVTINEEIAIEAVLRNYARSNDFNGADRYLNVYEVNTNPPLLAVESYSTIDTPLQGMLNSFTGETTNGETITRSREIIIYEAKDLVKQ